MPQNMLSDIDVSENEIVRFYLPKIFKNKKQLSDGNLRQKAALQKGNT